MEKSQKMEARSLSARSAKSAVSLRTVLDYLPGGAATFFRDGVPRRTVTLPRQAKLRFAVGGGRAARYGL